MTVLSRAWRWIDSRVFNRIDTALEYAPALVGLLCLLIFAAVSIWQGTIWFIELFVSLIPAEAAQ